VKDTPHTGQLGGLHRRSRATSAYRSRGILRARLEDRREEIERALLVRVYGIDDPTEVGDLSYLEGFRSAAAAAVEFSLATLESSQDRLPLIPPVLLSQARLAARNGVGVDTVLRRYTAGHALLVDFLIEEVERGGDLPAAELRRVLAASSSAFDRLLAAVSEEHAREHENQKVFSPERPRLERVERLLAGEPIDTSTFAYGFDGWHTAVILEGKRETGGLQALVKSLDCAVMKVQARSGQTWAWLGGPRRVESSELADGIDGDWPPDVVVALGEPTRGLAGWRLTHRQAKAVLPIARHSGEKATRYTDVGLLAAVSRDEVLVDSLEQLYLTPLFCGGKQDRALMETLNAYLTTGRNITSAAARLKINRETVRNRLRLAEEKLGQPLDKCAVEVELALRLSDIRTPGVGHSTASTVALADF